MEKDEQEVSDEDDGWGPMCDFIREGRARDTPLDKLSSRDVEEKRPKNSKWIKEIIIIAKSPTGPPETPD